MYRPGEPMAPTLISQAVGLQARTPAQLALAWMGAARARRVIVLLVGVWILNAFDLALTIHAHADGMLHEGNPIARAVLPYGPAAVFLFKAGIVTAASYVLYRYRHRWCSELASAFGLFAYAGVAIQWKLCYEMYDIALSPGASCADLAQVGTWSQFMAFF